MLSTPLAVFGEPFLTGGNRVEVCAATPRFSAGILTVEAPSPLRAATEADVVILPGWRDAREPVTVDLVDTLRTAHRRGAVVVGLCLGAFGVAEAGCSTGGGRRRIGLTPTRSRPAFPGRGRSGRPVRGPGSGAHLRRDRLRPRLLPAPAGPALRSGRGEPRRPPSRRRSPTGGPPTTGDRPAEPRHLGGSPGERAPGSPLGRPMRAGPAGRTRRRRRLEPPQPHAPHPARTGGSLGDWLRRARLARAQDLLADGARGLDDIAPRSGFPDAHALRAAFRVELGLTPTQWQARQRAGWAARRLR